MQPQTIYIIGDVWKKKITKIPFLLWIVHGWSGLMTQGVAGVIQGLLTWKMNEFLCKEKIEGEDAREQSHRTLLL